MFTEADLEALVPRKIFERGSAYYEDNAVGRIRRTGDTFKAKVEGTETYRVELTNRPGKPPKIYCDCPYDYGDVCKHGIALGLAVLDLFGGATETKSAAAPAALTEKDRRALLLSAAWARTTDRERLAFLRQLLLQKPKALRRFLSAFKCDEALLLAVAARPAAPAP
ncbi:SWIM zinc finger domain-containing protein, partial [Hymenobacter sp. IS2118]|uniref:SWIM zinc finger family protein n=1 Tax=Hymenobacter sp. IS2118 TaxID=1505605 RepID=UPI00190F55AA